MKIAERVLAAGLVAGLAGLVFGLVVAIQVIVEDGLTARGEAFGPLAAGVAGFPAIVSLTPAAREPWRAVPRLCAGAIAGLVVACGICLLPLGEWYSFMDYRGPGPLPAIALSTALVSLGAYISARALPNNV
jgi:hypothetical protein